MKNILLLGGTGAIGSNIIKVLSSETNITVYVTSRSSHASYKNINYIKCNAKKNIEILPILSQKKWDAILDFMIYKTKEFDKRCDMLLDSTKHYFFFSSARVYANSSEPITEKTNRLLDVVEDKKYLKTDEYALLKAREEDILKKKGIKNWTIIRPYITYDVERMQLGIFEKETWLYRILNGKTLIFDNEIMCKETTMTYGYDLAKQIVLLINNSKSYGEIYQITAPYHNNWNNILNLYLKTIEKRIGIKAKIKLLPNSSQKIGNSFQAKYDRMYNRIFNSSKIVHATGYDEFTSINDGLSKCLNTFLDNPKFRNINWKTQAKMDKMSGEKTKMSSIPSFKNKLKYFLFYNIIK